MPEKQRPGGETPEHDWRLKDIQKLIDLLVEREISEFEMERDGFRIRIRRGEAHAPAPAVLAPSMLPVPLPVVPAPPPAPAEPAPAAAAPPLSGAEVTPPAESTDGLYIIKSPIVGTFYASPSPNAEPFVQPGDVVHIGQVLCIIEAMKLMNEIQSEANGEVVRIYAESGQPVEYGQSLFAINPSHKK